MSTAPDAYDATKPVARGFPSRIMFVLALALIAGAMSLFPESRKQATATMEPSSFVGSEMAFSPCLPYDAALGSTNGDPHGYMVFSREHELKRQQELCGPSFAQAPGGQ